MKPSLTTILIFAVVLLGIGFTVLLLKGTQKSYFKEYINEIRSQRDSAIAETNREREEKDRIIDMYLQQDSILKSSFQKNQANYKPIYETLKNIPINYSRISNNDAALLIEFAKRER